jgi:hypothetical protein
MTQDQVTEILVKRRFRVDHSSYDEYEGGDTFYLSRKPAHYMTQCVEIDPEGFCNGLPLSQYLNELS